MVMFLDIDVLSEVFTADVNTEKTACTIKAVSWLYQILKMYIVKYVNIW